MCVCVLLQLPRQQNRSVRMFAPLHVLVCACVRECVCVCAHEPISWCVRKTHWRLLQSQKQHKHRGQSQSGGAHAHAHVSRVRARAHALAHKHCTDTHKAVKLGFVAHRALSARCPRIRWALSSRALAMAEHTSWFVGSARRNKSACAHTLRWALAIGSRHRHGGRRRTARVVLNQHTCAQDASCAQYVSCEEASAYMR